MKVLIQISYCNVFLKFKFKLLLSVEQYSHVFQITHKYSPWL